MSKWNEQDTQFLIVNYDNYMVKELAHKLNKSYIDVCNKRTSLGLRKHQYYKRTDKLLLDNLEAFYWIGYLLADGHFREKYISASCSMMDITHLTKLAEFIETSNKISVKNNTSYRRDKQHAILTVGDKVTSKLLCDKFDIQSNKTKNPPNMKNYNFSQDQTLSLIIGFIDGDGCITSRKKGKDIRLKVHSSWNENLIIMNTTIHKFCNEIVTNKIGISGEYPCLCISKKKVLNDLRQFTKQHNLPILERKWSKLD